jgi:hypothetical protein
VSAETAGYAIARIIETVEAQGSARPRNSSSTVSRIYTPAVFDFAAMELPLLMVCQLDATRRWSCWSSPAALVISTPVVSSAGGSAAACARWWRYWGKRAPHPRHRARSEDRHHHEGKPRLVASEVLSGKPLKG